MTLGYIDLENIDHLEEQARGGGIYDDRLWRESYYFNVTDPGSGLSILATIGMLPNKKRTAGFVLLMRNGKVVLLKLLAELRRPVRSRYVYRLKGLTFSVEGAGWRLKYGSPRCTLDIGFVPITRIHPYMDDGTDDAFLRMGSQHYEQAGRYTGTIILDGETIRFGPCLGHRDHSWGIRDWAAVDRYRLFCIGFSEDLAFNLWEGRIGGRDFVKGYVFDGKGNAPIVKSRVVSRYQRDGRTPEGAEVWVRDAMGREYSISCEVVTVVPFPLRGSVLYETVSRMRCDGMEGLGLLEYLYREKRFRPRMRAYMKVLGML